MNLDKGGKEYEQVKPGTYGAALYRIIDIGTQVSDYEGDKKSSRQAVFTWELNEKMGDGRNFSVSAFYTISAHEKANLRKVISAWTSRTMTDAEAKAFDLSSLLGQNCLLSVGTNQKGKTKVVGVTALPKGMPLTTLSNPTSIFDLDAFDAQAFATLPEWAQAKIKLSPEYAKAIGADKISPVEVPF